MRVRTWSACAALAWGILLIVTAVGSTGPFRPAQANTRIAGSTSDTSTTTIQVTLTSSVTQTLTTTPTGRPEAAAAAAIAPAAIARPAARPRARASTSLGAGTGSYVVRPGDTLSGIAAAFGTPGGWPALYAANREVIGPDPGLIRPGTTLALPGAGAAARYTVGAGDTLSGIASALGTPGGWPALYAANRQAIGPDPDAIRAGTVLAIPHPASPASPASHPARPAPPASHPASTPTRTPASARATAPAAGPASASAQPPAQASAPASALPSRPTSGRRHPRSAPMPTVGGLPRWLEIVLVAAGLLIATAFLTEPVLAIARRRRAARPAAADAHIVLADYERLVVTHSRQDGTVYVLRPPDADPEAILLAARLVLAQDRYEALAGHLGVPAHWPRE
jgi:nucleoid-associated protein YgaU